MSYDLTYGISNSALRIWGEDLTFQHLYYNSSSMILMDLKPDKNTFLLAITCVILGMVLMGLIMSLVTGTHKEAIYTEKAPEPIGPYSQAISIDRYEYTSGQIGINPETGILAEGLEEQTRQVMQNLQAVLSASGMGFDDVVNTHIYLTNISDFAIVNEIYAEYMGEAKPPRSTVGVAALPKGALVEIEMIAEKG